MAMTEMNYMSGGGVAISPQTITKDAANAAAALTFSANIGDLFLVSYTNTYSSGGKPSMPITGGVWLDSWGDCGNAVQWGSGASGNIATYVGIVQATATSVTIDGGYGGYGKIVVKLNG